MPIKIGSIDISKVGISNFTLSKVYIGDVQLWPSANWVPASYSYDVPTNGTILPVAMDDWVNITNAVLDVGLDELSFLDEANSTYALFTVDPNDVITESNGYSLPMAEDPNVIISFFNAGSTYWIYISSAVITELYDGHDIDIVAGLTLLEIFVGV